jgi:hypothetical protein
MTGDDLPSLTVLQRRIVDAACDIAELDTENPEFLHAVLCQCGLPRSRPKERKCVHAPRSRCREYWPE